MSLDFISRWKWPFFYFDLVQPDLQRKYFFMIFVPSKKCPKVILSWRPYPLTHGDFFILIFLVNQTIIKNAFKIFFSIKRKEQMEWVLTPWPPTRWKNTLFYLNHPSVSKGVSEWDNKHVEPWPFAYCQRS